MTASEWLLSVADLAKRLNKESTRDGRAPNKPRPVNNGD
jgi:hypothetical protein